tara:strand:+ start:59 stop:193 length:135 start_codon:yes stop_codon:yes gene_type:complete
MIIKTHNEKFKCSKCGTSHVDVYDEDGKRYISCLNCGFEETINT